MQVVIQEKPKGLEAQIPQPAPATPVNIPPPQTTIVIQVHHAAKGAEHPQVKVHDEVVESDRLRERDIYAIRIERIASVEGDDDIDFQDIADVIAIAARAVTE